MVSSGTVSSDLQNLTSVFSNYDSLVGELSNFWKGESHDNLETKATEFSQQFQSTIQNQMNAFAEACNLYDEYLLDKENLEITKRNYQRTAEANDSRASAYAQQATEYANRINTLNTEIQNLLAQASSPKLEATLLKGGSGDFVNYYQYNYSQPYSQGTIKTSGCGPTSMAMVLTHLTGQEVTPVEMAAKGNGRYTCSQGTVWTYFGDMAKQYGVSCQQMGPSTSNIINSLNAGKTLILSMAPGHFTKGGHFIVVRGIADNGQLIVSDPNSEQRSNQTWDPNLVASESRQIWAFE